MRTNELREQYLAFFESKGHTRCPSDVLVPTWDPSVLFTPAGMNQFKDHFLGKVKLDFTRATTCQKCLRTGDIDNVGRTAYHHTFFEMMGNFSFGDYFKREAINWAWEFLTDKKWLGIDPGRLKVTVYQNDDEAAEIWRGDIGLSSAVIERMGEHDNFWPAGAPSSGPDGVCGPCSEIFYQDNFGEIVEIWNLVFTQFHRVGDPPDNLRPLPSQNIDTGMGLERTAATLQGEQTNYHIDILRPIVEAAAEICGVKYEADSDSGRRLRRITDHIRACTMAVHENVYPGAQKEKYVIRRLLRRAVLDGHQLGMRMPFLFQVVPAVVEQMHAAYPDLLETTSRVSDVIKAEENNFFGTLDAGLARIENTFAEMKAANRTMVAGVEAADLYQTYGVPPEVFEAMAAENNLVFDWDGYGSAMEAHGTASGKAVHTVMGGGGPIDAIKKVLHETQFVGYDVTEAEAELKFIISQGQLCDSVASVEGDEILQVVLDRSPFYGESGGQVGDVGEILGDAFKFQVTDTQKDGKLILHYGHLLTGQLNTGAPVQAKVDFARRAAVRRAHSGTHMLHFALQKNLGSHAQQQGSKVDADWLRFDFTNLSPIDADILTKIEQDASGCVQAATEIKAEVLPLAEARKVGAMMLFGEKYPDPVRMVSMGEFSKELCGGTHLDNTRDVEVFEIISEEAVSAGTRRITALTGAKAKENREKTQVAVTETAELLGVGAQQITEAIRGLSQRVRELKKQLAGGGQTERKVETRWEEEGSAWSHAEAKTVLRDCARILNVAVFDVPERTKSLLQETVRLDAEIANLSDVDQLSAESLLENAEDVGDVKVVVAEAMSGNPNLLRQLIDQMRKKSNAVAALLGLKQGENKVVLVAGVSKELVDRGIHAGEWIGEVATIVGGRGGGKADMAQAGGKDISKLAEALEVAKSSVRCRINSEG